MRRERQRRRKSRNPSHLERRPQVPTCVPGEPLREPLPKAGLMKP